MVSFSQTLRVDASPSEEQLTFILDKSFWGLRREEKLYDAFKTLNVFRKNILSFSVCASRGFQRPKNNYMTKLIPTLNRDQWFLALSDCLSHVVSRPSYWLNRMLTICATRDDLLKYLPETSGNTLLGKLNRLYSGKAPLTYPSTRIESHLLDSFMRSVEDAEISSGGGRVNSKFIKRATDLPIRNLALELIQLVIGSAFPLMNRRVHGDEYAIINGEIKWGFAPNQLIVQSLMERYGKKVQTGKFLKLLAKALLVILGEVKCAQDLLGKEMANNESSGASRDDRRQTHEMLLRLDCFFEVLLPIISLVVISSIAGGGKLYTSKAELDDLLMKTKKGVKVVELSNERMAALRENERLRDEEDFRRWEIRERRTCEDYLGKSSMDEAVEDERQRRNLVKDDQVGAKCDRVVETSVASALKLQSFIGSELKVDDEQEESVLVTLSQRLTEESIVEGLAEVGDDEEQSISSASITFYEYVTGSEETPEGSFQSALDFFEDLTIMDGVAMASGSESDGEVEYEAEKGPELVRNGDTPSGDFVEVEVGGAAGGGDEVGQLSPGPVADQSVAAPFSSTRRNSKEFIEHGAGDASWGLSIIQPTPQVHGRPVKRRRVEMVDADEGQELEEVTRRLETQIETFFVSVRPDMLRNLRIEQPNEVVTPEETEEDKKAREARELEKEEERVRMVDKVLGDLKTYIITSTHPKNDLLWKKVALKTLETLMKKVGAISRVTPLKKRVDVIMMTSKYLFLVHSEGMNLQEVGFDKFSSFKYKNTWLYDSKTKWEGLSKGHFKEVCRVLGGTGQPRKTCLIEILEVLLGEKAEITLLRMQKDFPLGSK